MAGEGLDGLRVDTSLGQAGDELMPQGVEIEHPTCLVEVRNLGQSEVMLDQDCGSPQGIPSPERFALGAPT
jgi:hypothetical protein